MSETSPHPPTPTSCRFVTCGSTVLTRYRGWLESIHGVGAFGEVLVCPEHERWLKTASILDGVTNRISLEGWVWIDNLSFVAYGS